MTALPDRPATYREVLAVREFRTLWLAEIASLLGDQVARVAVAVLVLNRSNSPLLAAMAYAVSYLPWVVAGPVLSPLADRQPRRQVMVRCDVARAGSIAMMALPGLPLPALFTMLITASMLSPPFEAARAATVADVLTGDRYVVGSSLANITGQAANVLGFLLGGVAVVTLRTRGALLADAVTFLVSAGLIRLGVRSRPPVARDGRPTLVADIVEGTRIVFTSRVLRAVLLLAWSGAAFGIVPEGLAVSYARELGYGPLATGVLTATTPAGLVVGALVVGRFVAPRTRIRLVLPLAAGMFVPLVVTAVRPSLPVAVGLWTLSGAGLAYQLPANASFMRAVPEQARGRAFGLAQAGLQVGQGLGLAAAGALALVLPVHQVVGVAGVVGLVVVGLIALRWPAAEIAALHPAPVDEAAPGEAPVAPVVEPAESDWLGPYPLEARRRVILGRLVPTDEPTNPPG